MCPGSTKPTYFHGSQRLVGDWVQTAMQHLQVQTEQHGSSFQTTRQQQQEKKKRQEQERGRKREGKKTKQEERQGEEKAEREREKQGKKRKEEEKEEEEEEAEEAAEEEREEEEGEAKERKKEGKKEEGEEETGKASSEYGIIPGLWMDLSASEKEPWHVRHSKRRQALDMAAEGQPYCILSTWTRWLWKTEPAETRT